MTNIAEEELDFKVFERAIFEIMCRVACELMRIYLELRDLRILGTRDTKEYRYVGRRATTVKTIMGEVTYSRVYYKRKSGGYVFLLDEAMGIGCGCGLVSENLAEQIVAECTEKSFRKAAGSVSNSTGQNISGMGAWNVFQMYGEAVARQEGRLKELDEGGSTGHLGNVPSRVVFDEYDDVWVSMQNGERQKRGGGAAEAAEEGDKAPKKKTGKKPIHVGTAYTGWMQEKDGRYSTADKVAYASFGDVSKFTAMFESLLRHCYDMDGVERRVTNGDGEQWVKTVAESNDSILQLDPYHRSQAVIKAVGDKDDRKAVFDAICGKDVGKALNIIQSLGAKAQDEKPRKKLGELYTYFNNNRDSLLTWQERGIELPAPPEGMEYRNLGVQESSNCTLIAQRMKHRRGSWSPEGGGHMARILCFRNTVGLDAIMGPLPEPPAPNAWIEPLSAAKAPQHDGKGYDGGWLHAEMPFEQAFKTHGREAIRNMLRMKPLSQLAFK